MNTTSTFMKSILILLMILSSCLMAQTPSSFDPKTTQSFAEATAGMHIMQDYTFGTNAGKAITDLQRLANYFEPYGIAGTTVINQEWERYQKFNPENFVFKPNSLDLTATLANNGGLRPGGINSGQIWSKQTFQPGRTGHSVYAFDVRMRIPSGNGMWPAFWLYTKTPEPGKSDGSEIDNPEFFIMSTQDESDWTGYSHGPGVGESIYSITRKGILHQQVKFSSDYHDFQTLWTPDAVYKYIDGKLVDARRFKWTSPSPANFGVNLAVGSSIPDLPGLKPTSLSQFPSALSIEFIRVWAR
jgi:beta-glucanase (GH16 family)